MSQVQEVGAMPVAEEYVAQDCMVTILIPCLNEERSLGDCLSSAVEALDKLGIAGEIVVVDNGSVDKSVDIAKSHEVRVIVEGIRGYGSALRRGMHEARGKYIIMMDADRTYDFSQIGGFLRLLEGGADLVMGNRFAGAIAPGAMPWLHRWVGTPFLTATLNLLYHTGVSDVNCGLRGFRRAKMEALGLECNGMEFASEMLVKASQQKLRIAEIPVDYDVSPVKRTPHLRTFQDGWRHLRLLLLGSPQHVLFVPGLFVLILGLALCLHLAVTESLGADTARRLSRAILATGCLFIGAQTMVFGACAMAFSGGLYDRRTVSRFLRETFSLERGLVASAAMIAAGLSMKTVVAVLPLCVPFVSACVSAWLMKVALFSTWAVLAGMQLLFSSLYVSVLGGRWNPK